MVAKFLEYSPPKGATPIESVTPKEAFLPKPCGPKELMVPRKNCFATAYAIIKISTEESLLDFIQLKIDCMEKV